MNKTATHSFSAGRHRQVCRRSAAWIALCAVFSVLACGPLAAAPVLTVRIAFLGPLEGDSHAGASQGIAEANAQGKFLGLEYRLVEAKDMSAALAADGAAIVVEAAAASLPTLAAAAEGTALLNVSAEDDSLRELCIPNLLHTIPSHAMREDAQRQWHQQHAASKAQAQAWHGSAELYAGTQLNKRYSDKVGRAMNDRAWAAWAAVKLVADTVARLHSADRAALLNALHHSLVFDGQKGVDMSFRDNGQLRQPLLLIEDGKIVGEAPVRGVAKNGDLDSLGATSCAK